MISNSHQLEGSQVDIRSINHAFRGVEEEGEEGRDEPGVGSPQKRLQVRSEQPAVTRSVQDLDRVGYKRQLLVLMVRVKFERFGFGGREVEAEIEKQAAQLHQLETVEGRHLSQMADEIFLEVFSAILGERSLLRRMLGQRAQQHTESEGERQPREPSDEVSVPNNNSNVIREGAILCNICYSTAYRFCSEECSHSFCVDCMRGYLRECLRSDTYFIKCPQFDCQQLVSLQTVEAILSRRDFKRFIYFREKNEKEMDPDNRFCSKPDCGELLRPDDARLHCPKCQADFCEVCLQPFHAGSKCDAVLRRALQAELQALQIRKCPGCRSPIEKSDGCNHMTCKKCSFEFCWICMRKYSKHHYRYYNCFGCPGMQFQQEDHLPFQRLKQCTLYLLLPLILAVVLVCYLAALPVYMVGTLLANPCSWAQQKREFWECRLARCLLCGDHCLSRVLAWLLLQPRGVLFALFVAPVKLTVLLCSQVCSVFD